MNNDLLVSVAIVTYNHEKYISKALDSILSQECDFNFEIVIGEDNSPDSTRAICEKYEALYPNKIKLLRHEKNVGMMKNFSLTFAACSGKYIAQCDGDDYWTDTKKLQKQADFLENNPDYSLCFNKAEQLVSGEMTEMSLTEIYRTGDYIPENIWNDWIITTSSVMFKREVVNTSYFLKYFTHKKMLQQDVFIITSAYQQGKIYGLEDTMSVYRKHDGAITSDASSPPTKRMQPMLDYIALIGKLFNKKYHKISKQYYSFKSFRYAYVCKERRLYIKSLGFLLQSFFSSPAKFISLIKKEFNSNLK